MFIAALNEVRSTNILLLSRKAAETVDRVQIRLYDILILAIGTFLVATNYIQYVERIQLRNEIRVPVQKTDIPIAQNISFSNFESRYQPSYPIIVMNQEHVKLLEIEEEVENQESTAIELWSVQESPTKTPSVQKIGSVSISSIGTIQKVQTIPQTVTVTKTNSLATKWTESSTKSDSVQVMSDDTVQTVLKEVAILVACQAVVGAIFPMLAVVTKSAPILRNARRFSIVATRFAKNADKVWRNLIKFYSLTSGSKIVTRGKKIIKMFMHFGDDHSKDHHPSEDDHPHHH